MRVHVVTLPHTLLTRDYDWCAYTAKCRRFVGMLSRAGHDAIVYGPDVHDVPTAAEYVVIADEADRLRWFGRSEWDADRVFDRWEPSDDCWNDTNRRAVAGIEERYEPGDVVGIIAGGCQGVIADHFQEYGVPVVEWGIGYSGTLPLTHKVYESYAWMHFLAGKYGRDDVQFYNTVIPNCFDVEDFSYRSEPGSYLLYMGRPTPRKGLPIVEEIAKRAGVPVLIAGQPGPPIPNTTHVGLVRGRAKADLLAGALALLAPTTYLEPFGGVAVEAMMSGTPVITTDWGAFTETVVHGVTGYRCSLLAEFMRAVENARGLHRPAIRAHAVANYSTVAGAARYDAYLQRLATLQGAGWYAGVE